MTLDIGTLVVVTGRDAASRMPVTIAFQDLAVVTHRVAHSREGALTLRGLRRPVKSFFYSWCLVPPLRDKEIEISYSIPSPLKT